jgi:hypothetical protein
MTIYTVHLHDQDAQAADFVPDRFSWGAFVFAPLWLLWHRLWVPAFLWGVVMAIIFAVPLGLSFFAKEFAAFLIAFLCGLEGNEWRRQKLLREGKPLTDIVSGDTQDDAEIHFFHRWQETASVSPTPPPASQRTGQVSATEPAFGLFPEPEKHP